MGNRLIVVDAKNDERWDEFVNNHPWGNVYHSSAWLQVLETTFGYTPCHLALEDENKGELEGILPLFFVHRLSGNRMVSLPLTAYCRRLMPETEFENITHYIERHFSRKACVELKFDGRSGCGPEIFSKSSHYVTHVLELDSDLQKTFRKFHDTSVRQKIKRAEKNGLTFRMADTEKDLKEFYRLYLAIRKKHGLPPHPYAFFSNMWKILKPRNLMIAPFVELEREVVAAGIILKSRSTYHLEYSASDRDRNMLFPNHRLIWNSIQTAHREGYRYFDFGRSSIANISLTEFKERWGAQKHELEYWRYPKEGKYILGEASPHETLKKINMILPDFLLVIEGYIFYQLVA